MPHQPLSLNRILSRSVMAVVVLLLTLSLYRPGQAAPAPVLINRKISGTMLDSRTVMNFHISPDGHKVAFAADRDTLNMYELYVVPTMGGAEPLKISGEIMNGGGVDEWTFQISPVTQRVVYLASGQEPDGRVDKVELYSVSLTGAGLVKLNAPLTTNGNVDSFMISPNGQYVVYRADQAADEVYQLYSVPIDGSDDPHRLNTDLQADGDVQEDYQISPNNAWIVYRAQEDTSDVTELYRNGPLGLAHARLNTGILAGHGVDMFKITPNSAGVVFRSHVVTTVTNIYSNYMDPTDDSCGSGAPFQLSHLTPLGALVSQFEITPNSLKVVYSANEWSENKVELFSNSICGGVDDVETLSGSLTLGVDNVEAFTLDSVDARVVFTVAVNGVERELYSNAINGGEPLRLTPDLPAGQSLGYPEITNANTRVVYYVGSISAYELASVPITSPITAPVDLSGPMGEGGNVLTHVIAPNRLWIAFRATIETGAQIEIYLNFTAGGTRTKLNGPLTVGGATNYYDFTPDSNVLVYQAAQDVAGKYELYISYFGYKVHLSLIKR